MIDDIYRTDGARLIDVTAMIRAIIALFMCCQWTETFSIFQQQEDEGSLLT
jgi:hypothetical protein